MLALDLQRYLIHSDYLKDMFHIDRVLHFAKFEDSMSFCYETSCFIVDVKPAQLELYVTPILLETGDYDVHFQVVYRESGFKPFVSSSVDRLPSVQVKNFNDKLKTFVNG